MGKDLKTISGRDPHMVNLSGRTAVVTGAGSGIGAAIAGRLFRRGASLELVARTGGNVKKVAENLDAGSARVRWHVCDVRDESEVRRVGETILQRTGKIDILVTCAAAPAAAGKTEELGYREWRSVLDTDLDGVFLCCKAFGAGMVEKRYGRIVNLTSFHNVATYPNRAAYNAAKSGVEGLTRALAVEWGCYGVTVNCVAPGPIDTPGRRLSQSGRGVQQPAGHPTRGTGRRCVLVAYLVSRRQDTSMGSRSSSTGGWTKCAWWGRHEKKY
jgi:NAD(P)-dependent dehydrogenase (short-subunit alcohol dehydrogenase family)